MGTKQVAWEDGRGNILFTSIEGTAKVEVSSDTRNDSLDRRQLVAFRPTHGSASPQCRYVVQHGEREALSTKKGKFRTREGYYLAVRKSR